MKQRGVLRSGVDGVAIGQRRLEVPDAFELPRVLRAVVPLMRAGRAVVDELVALALGHAARPDEILRLAPGRIPRLAAIIGALDDLPEPAARLRGVDAIRVYGRPFH